MITPSRRCLTRVVGVRAHVILRPLQQLRIQRLYEFAPGFPFCCNRWNIRGERPGCRAELIYGTAWASDKRSQCSVATFSIRRRPTTHAISKSASTSSFDWKRGNFPVKKKRRIMPADHISIADQTCVVSKDAPPIIRRAVTDPHFVHNI